MYRLNTEEIHRELLLMLKDIKKVCETNEINYYLSGGTLLGAVRHRGFIPWDDDIDIMMLREDYVKFEVAYLKYGKFHMWSRNTTASWNTPWNRVENKDTVLKNENAELTHGLFIDIFPIDRVSDNLYQQKIIYGVEKSLDVLRNGARRTNVAEEEKGKKLKKILINPLGRLIGSYRLSCYIDSFAQKTSRRFEGSKYCASIVSMFNHKTNEIVPITIYDDLIMLNFESEKFSVPIGYETYLKNLYGDYMELPSKKERNPKHYPVFWKNDK